MRKSPRTRRLEADNRGIEQLAANSSIFDFEKAPEAYRFRFQGPGTYKTKRNTVAIHNEHEIVVDFGAAYPRLMPGLVWQTPIFHPNISSSGIVCLGGYGTNWVPSLRLDELCVMLWDMIRYQNYDVESPYNREAALWAREQKDFSFPLDIRPLRDLVSQNDESVVTASLNSKPEQPPVVVDVNGSRSSGSSKQATESNQATDPSSDVLFLDQPEKKAQEDGITFLD